MPIAFTLFDAVADQSTLPAAVCRSVSAMAAAIVVRVLGRVSAVDMIRSSRQSVRSARTDTAGVAISSVDPSQRGHRGSLSRGTVSGTLDHATAARKPIRLRDALTYSVAAVARERHRLIGSRR
jgi:hypothetical protein